MNECSKYQKEKILGYAMATYAANYKQEVPIIILNNCPKNLKIDMFSYAIVSCGLIKNQEAFNKNCN
jgi:ribosomal protein L30E